MAFLCIFMKSGSSFVCLFLFWTLHAYTFGEQRGCTAFIYIIHLYIEAMHTQSVCIGIFFMLINNIKCSNVIFIYAAELRFGRTGANDEVLNQNVQFHHICVAEPLKRIVFHWGEIITEGSFPLKNIYCNESDVVFFSFVLFEN